MEPLKNLPAKAGCFPIITGLLFDTIVSEIPGPEANDDAVPQFLITNLGYDSYVGQLLIGRLENGTLACLFS